MTDQPKKELFLSVENHQPDFAWTVYTPPYKDSQQVVVIRMTSAGAKMIRGRLDALLLRDAELNGAV